MTLETAYMTSREAVIERTTVTRGMSMILTERKYSMSSTTAMGSVSECTKAASACTAMLRSWRIVRSPPRKDE